MLKRLLALFRRRKPPPQRAVTPDQVNDPDPYIRHVVAEAFNRGEPVYFVTDADGNLREVE